MIVKLEQRYNISFVIEDKSGSAWDVAYTIKDAVECLAEAQHRHPEYHWIIRVDPTLLSGDSNAEGVLDDIFDAEPKEDKVPVYNDTILSTSLFV